MGKKCLKLGFESIPSVLFNDKGWRDWREGIALGFIILYHFPWQFNRTFSGPNWNINGPSLIMGFDLFSVQPTQLLNMNFIKRHRMRSLLYS